MNNQDINNHFGDMDMFLMDAILKGHILENGKVLDVGCGEGRNGIYFIKEGHTYLGVDSNASKIRLLEYLSKSLGKTNASFEVSSIEEVSLSDDYDLIIASRVLHFAESGEEFQLVWKKLMASLKAGGLVYFSMDSAMCKEFVVPRENGKYEFRDGRISFALTGSQYLEMKEGCSEAEKLRTVIHHGERAQSFGLLRKH